MSRVMAIAVHSRLHFKVGKLSTSVSAWPARNKAMGRRQLICDKGSHADAKPISTAAIAKTNRAIQSMTMAAGAPEK